MQVFGWGMHAITKSVFPELVIEMRGHEARRDTVVSAWGFLDRMAKLLYART